MPSILHIIDIYLPEIVLESRFSRSLGDTVDSTQINETTCIFSDKYKFWRGFMARFAKKQAQKMKNRVILAKTQHWFIQTLS